MKTIEVKVITNAKRVEIIENDSSYVTVKLTATPEKGKANQQLIKLLSKKYGIPTSAISIIKGLTSRHKLVTIQSTEKSKSK